MSSKFAMSIGVVKNNADAKQSGRLQIYIPSVDPQSYTTADLAWASYVSPFAGTTVDYMAGREQSVIPGMSTYGLWAIPKIGAQVLCGFFEGNPSARFWMGCIYMPDLNRTLPQSLDGGLSELDPSGYYPQKTIPHYQKNLTAAGLQAGTVHYKTRGGYERSVSYPASTTGVKSIANGYGKNPAHPESADSQTICLTSPGRHYFVMSDVDEYCRIRLKTTEGSQIIFDDTNERIYISTAQGKNWIELDEGNGKVYIYSDSKVSIRAKNDINMYSDENINIVANKRVNIKSETRSVNLEAVHDVRLLSTSADIMLTASRDIHLKTTKGPIAGPESEKMSCSTGTLGWLYEWPEKGGSSSSSIRLDSAESVEVSAMKDLNLTSKISFNIKSISDITIQSGTTTNISATDAVDISGSAINLPGSPGIANAASPAVQVTSVVVSDHMIQPNHEPWIRDPDEAKCKTPRNKKYQG